jgi:hypothetical protein
VYFVFLRPDVGAEMGIRDGAACGDGMMGDEVDGVCPFDAAFDSLGQASELVGSGM